MTPRETKEKGIEDISTDVEQEGSALAENHGPTSDEASHHPDDAPPYEAFVFEIPLDLLRAALEDRECLHDPEIMIFCRRSAPRLVEKREDPIE
jgi:hypothetical protein